MDSIEIGGPAVVRRATSTSIKEREKLSEIIGREIEKFLQDQTVLAGEDPFNYDDDSKSVTYEQDIQQLITLSKDMQSEFNCFLNRGDCGLSAKPPGGRGVCGQPSETSQFRLLDIPPLRLDEDDHHANGYCNEVVSKHFKKANKRVKKVFKSKTDAGSRKYGELAGKTCPASFRSQPSLKTKKINITRRMYPKVHSCVELRVAKKHNKPRGSQSARAYSARYYNFNQTHPNIKLSETDTLFPCRGVRSECLPFISQESVNFSDLIGMDYHQDCQQSSAEEGDQCAGQYLGPGTGSSVENEQYAEASEIPKLSNIDTWHNVLSSNSILQTTSNEPAAVADLAEEPPSIVREPDGEPDSNNTIK